MTDTWWSWGVVEPGGASVLLDGTTVPVLVASSLVGTLVAGEAVWCQMVGRAVVVHGRSDGGRGWSYEVPTASAGWVTVARFPGNGRAEGTFRLYNDESGDHDMLVFLVQVAYSQVSINLLSYNPFGRSSPGITGIRYLTDSTDVTYGPGILQVRLSETLANWSVSCEQPVNFRLKPWEPMSFSTSTSGYNTTTPAAQNGVYPTTTTLLTLENGYTNYSAAPSWDEARVTMLPGSQVSLSGLVSFTAATSSTLATLPEGLWPRGDVMFPAYAFASSTGQIGRVQVTDTGLLQMTLPSYGGSGYVSLSGITYPAYQ